MKLTARQKYDYRALDRGEAQLIRTGHALWRDRRKLGDTVAERESINAALESVWKAKREYRVELLPRSLNAVSSAACLMPSAATLIRLSPSLKNFVSFASSRGTK